MRKRGPRSWEARARRQDRNQRNGAWTETSVSILHINTQGWTPKHVAELTMRLRLMDSRPLCICVNETWLDESHKNMTLEGYSLLGRLDRRDGRKGGGVAAFIATEFFERASLVEVSDKFERLWFILHTDQGPYLVGAWYRPPQAGEIESIDSLFCEYEKLSMEAVGTVIVGDMNVHQRRWLHFSAQDSVEGRVLWDRCRDHGLLQMVKEPTRGDHLLDLVLTDIHGMTCEVLPPIADHKLVLAKFALTMPKRIAFEREVWDFRHADWEGLRAELDGQDWSFLDSIDPSEGAVQLTTLLCRRTSEFVPSRLATAVRSTHPWLNPRVEALVIAKQRAAGTPQEREKAEACSIGTRREYWTYIEKVRQQLLLLPRSSKLWWKKNAGIDSEQDWACWHSSAAETGRGLGN